MTSANTRVDQRKLRVLWCAFVLYFLLMLYALRYAHAVPYQMLALAGVFNMAIIISFIVAIRRGHTRMAARPGSNETSSEIKSVPVREADVRRMRLLWIGLGLYFLIVLNAFRYVHRVPYQTLILGLLVNGAVIVTIIVAMRRVHRRLG